MKAREILIYLSLDRNGDWDDIYDDISSKRKDFTFEDYQSLAKNLKCNVLTLMDDNYPECLKQIRKPPFVLYYYGNLSLLDNYKKNLCVIGSRKPSTYGLKMTEDIISDLPNDLNIVSGLAYGIDAKAHESAITSNHKTIAIIGSGIDNCYPIENLDLYNKIKENHLIISEYPFDVAPDKSHFPMRNRLLAAVSCGIVVTDASYCSGTSITVNYALEIGRNVCCVPHRANEKSLCNKLIKDGACLVENANEVVDEISYVK